jgi:hypothetical protein
MTVEEKPSAGAPYETKGGATRCMLAIRLERPYAQLVSDLQRHHGVPRFSQYLRGLIYADAARQGLLVAGLDVPGWVARSYPELVASPLKPDRKATKGFPQKRARTKRGV